MAESKKFDNPDGTRGLEALRQNQREAQDKENAGKKKAAQGKVVGAKKSRRRKKAKKDASEHEEERKENQEVEEKLLQDLTEEDIRCLMRPYVRRSGTGNELVQVEGYFVHTFESAQEDFKRRGYRLIYQATLGIDKVGARLVCSYYDQKLLYVDLRDGDWAVPVVWNGARFIPFLIPPPPELWPEGMDDGSFRDLEERMEKRWLDSTSDLGDPISRILRYLLADSSREYFDLEIAEKLKSVGEREYDASEHLLELLEAYDLLGHAQFDEFSFPAEESNERESGVRKKKSLEAKSRLRKEEILEMHQRMKELSHAAFMAGREFERNIIAPDIAPAIKAYEGFPKPGASRTSHTEVFTQALVRWQEKRGRKTIPSPGILKKFILKSENTSWIAITNAALIEKPTCLKNWIKAQGKK
ncbi:MAG: hypothetical protein P1U90_16265 [Akkermansiaceae bacterium]|nr:hypothetical protein [Akkermansiaceae bacterium]